MDSYNHPNQNKPIDRQYEAVNPRRHGPLHPQVLVDKLEQLLIFFYFFLAALLAFRFVLALFGAKRTSLFVDFVYQLTLPFMFPFEGMFGKQPQVAQFRLEFEVLVALIVYALCLFGLSRLLRIIFR